MTSQPSSEAIARRRFRALVARVLSVQVASLLALWLLHACFGAP